MRTRTAVICPATIRFGAASARRTLSLMAVSLLALGLALGGCGPAMTRSKVSQEDLMKLRSTGDQRALEGGRIALGRLVERTKAQHDRYIAGGRKEPPVIDILVISGGGDWGAFGARGSSRAGERFPPSTRWPGPNSMPSPA